jgi:hypothetical protein
MLAREDHNEFLKTVKMILEGIRVAPGLEKQGDDEQARQEEGSR